MLTARSADDAAALEKGGKSRAPVLTLFFPPTAPDEMPPRYRPPPPPPPTYANDIATAGPEEHAAQTLIAKRWRGFSTRRALKSRFHFEEIQNQRALRIQCWWRTLLSVWRKRQLLALQKEWCIQTRDYYISQRVTGLSLMLTWQRHRVEQAATLIQRIYRWYHSTKGQRVRPQKYITSGLTDPSDTDEVEAPVRAAEQVNREVHPYPLTHKTKVYFPWLRRNTTRSKRVSGHAASHIPSSSSPVHVDVVAVTSRPNSNDKELHSSPLLARDSVDDSTCRPLWNGGKSVFHITPFKAHPSKPSPEEIEETNNAMRAREAAREYILSQPEASSRDEWKHDGLRLNDMDHNAGIIQRVFLSKLATESRHTREIRKAYFYRYVSIIQRTFRLFTTNHRIQRSRAAIDREAARKNSEYAAESIARIQELAVWDLHLLSCAAQTIQNCWKWYKYKRDGTLATQPRSEAGVVGGGGVPPPPPPYHLMDDYMAAVLEKDPVLRKEREQQIRDHKGVLARFTSRHDKKPSVKPSPRTSTGPPTEVPEERESPAAVDAADAVIDDLESEKNKEKPDELRELAPANEPKDEESGTAPATREL